MKMEIEITEEEIKSAVERKVRTAVADQTNQWAVDSYIKEQVKQYWRQAVDELVMDALKDSKRLKEQIAAEIERKLRNQLNAALKATAST